MISRVKPPLPLLLSLIDHVACMYIPSHLHSDARYEGGGGNVFLSHMIYRRAPVTVQFVSHVPGLWSYMV